MTSPAGGQVVADCSALLAVLFDEPKGVDLAAQLRDAHLVAPGLLRYELANVTWRKIRSRERLLDRAFTILDDALRLPIQYEEVDHVAATRLAVETGLTAYDASYLWLAEALGVELVTLDRSLNRVYLERR